MATLARLIRSQKIDRSSDKIRRRPHEATATDLGWSSLDRFASDESDEPDDETTEPPTILSSPGPRRIRLAVLLCGCQSWSRAQIDSSPCPVCSGQGLPTGWYCLACDRCGSDGQLSYGGALSLLAGPVAKPVYRPDPQGLKGGRS